MFFLNIETELRSSNDMQFFIKLLPENFSSVCVCVCILYENARGVRTCIVITPLRTLNLPEYYLHMLIL